MDTKCPPAELRGMSLTPREKHRPTLEVKGYPGNNVGLCTRKAQLVSWTAGHPGSARDIQARVLGGPGRCQGCTRRPADLRRVLAVSSAALSSSRAALRSSR